MAVYAEFVDRFRWKAAHLSDVMPWRAVAAPGVILHKQTHALQRSYLMRGPDLTSEVREVMGALMLQANNVFKRLRGQWTVHCEAQRLPVTEYPVSAYPSPAAKLIDDARRRVILEDPGSFETRYYLTLTWQPPSAVKSAWATMFLSGQAAQPLPRAAGVAEFVSQADYLVYLLRAMLAVGRPLTTDETLTYLHNCVSDRWHPVRLPALPVDIDVMLCDSPWHGGWYPQLGRFHVRICSIQSYPPQSLANAMQAIDHLGFPYRWSTRWIAMERQTQEYLLARVQRQWVGQEKSMRDILMQGLRGLSKPLQSWKPNRTTTVTEVAPKFVDRKVLIIPFPLQHTKGHQTAGQMMPLSTLRARLTARQPELIFADADDLLNLGPHAIQPPHLCSRQCQAIRGVVLGAVSDHQDLQATRQPATLRPIGVPAIGTHGLSVEPAVLLQAAYEIPPIVTNPLQQPSGGIPSIEQHKFGAAAQAMAGIAQQLQSQLVLRGSPLAPEPHPQRDPERPIRPHEQDQREAIHGATLLTGEHPRQPFNSPRKRLWNDRIVNDEIPSLPAEERVHGKGQECMPGPIRLQ
jgi:hypothetical protein